MPPSFIASCLIHLASFSWLISGSQTPCKTCGPSSRFIISPSTSTTQGLTRKTLIQICTFEDGCRCLVIPVLFTNKGNKLLQGQLCRRRRNSKKTQQNKFSLYKTFSGSKTSSRDPICSSYTNEQKGQDGPFQNFPSVPTKYEHNFTKRWRHFSIICNWPFRPTTSCLRRSVFPEFYRTAILSDVINRKGRKHLPKILTKYRAFTCYQPFFVYQGCGTSRTTGASL